MPRSCLVFLLLSVAAPASAQDVAILGPVPSDLAEELDWELGDIAQVRSVQEGFAAGADCVVVAQLDRMMLVHRDGHVATAPYPAPGQVSEAAAAIARFARGEAPPAVLPWNPPPQSAPVARRFSWSRHRWDQRLEHRWRLRLFGVVVNTPRDEAGAGPYGDSNVVPFIGVGIRGGVSYHLHPLARLDLTATFARVFGDDNLRADHGPEGALGGALILSSPWHCLFGGGFGIELVVAREIDAGVAGEHFGWVGFRMLFPVELGWPNRSGRGFILQLAPSLTRVPYADGFSPGLILSAGFELPI